MRGMGRFGSLVMASMGAAIAMSMPGSMTEPRPLERDGPMRKGRAVVRQGNHSVQSYFKGQSHRAAALAGGGSREVARRMRQIRAGRLQVSA